MGKAEVVASLGQLQSYPAPKRDGKKRAQSNSSTLYIFRKGLTHGFHIPKTNSPVKARRSCCLPLGARHLLAAVFRMDAVFAIVTSNALFSALALIWFVHIGVDRMLGYGLKYPEGFKLTHLGTIGKMGGESRGSYLPCGR